MLCGELGYRPADFYDLLHCELELILSGYHERLRRERIGRAWLATHIELVSRHDTLLMPWELLGEPDPDPERADRMHREQQAEAEAALLVDQFRSSGETPEQVLARFGVGG